MGWTGGEHQGRVVLRFGPLVYSLENVYQPLEKGEWHVLPGRLSILGKTMHNRSRLRYLCDTQ
jgi:hypothetical protein